MLIVFIESGHNLNCYVKLDDIINKAERKSEEEGIKNKKSIDGWFCGERGSAAKVSCWNIFQ